MRKTEIASGRPARSLMRGLRSRRQGAGWLEPRVNRFLATRWTSNTRRGPLRARSSPDLHRLRFPQNRPVLGAEQPAASYQKFSCYRYENLTRDKSGCSPVPGRADVWTPNPRSRGLPAVTRAGAPARPCAMLACRQSIATRLPRTRHRSGCPIGDIPVTGRPRRRTELSAHSGRGFIRLP